MSKHAKFGATRTRLSTLAVTASLATAGIGLAGAGTASAATPQTTPPAGGATDGTTAALSVDHTVAGAGAAVTLDAGKSKSGTANAVLAYKFDCGNIAVLPAVSTTNPTVAVCNYPVAGTYSADVTVSDDGFAAAGTNTAAAQAITVTATASPVLPTPPTTPNLNLQTNTLTYSVAGASVDKKLASASVGTIDWGDGTSTTPDTSAVKFTSGGVPTSKTLNLTHAYAASGVYNVTFTINDGVHTGYAAAPMKIDIPITPNPIFTVATGLAAYSAVADLSGITLDPAAVAAPANVVYTVAWGDGNTTTLKGYPQTTTTHVYTAAGPWKVTLTVDDGLGGPSSSIVSPIHVLRVNTTAVSPTVARVAGATRYDTGVIASRHRFATIGDTTAGAVHPEGVVLATGISFPDALSGVALAKKVNGPLLLTDGSQSTLDPEVLTEIERILPIGSKTAVYILGGLNAISPGIQQQLVAAGYDVARYGGADRYATSLQVAQSSVMGNPTHIVVARGDQGPNDDGFADALAAGPFAADVFGGGNAAVVLSNGDTLTPDVAAYVDGKLVTPGAGVSVAAVGGQAVTAVGRLNGVDFTATDTTANALAIKGTDRYDTARLVAAQFQATAQIGVATGTKFPDALTGGAYMASVGGPLLLTAPSVESSATGTALGNVASTVSQVTVFGGDKAVAAAAYNAISATVAGTDVTWAF